MFEIVLFISSLILLISILWELFVPKFIEDFKWSVFILKHIEKLEPMSLPHGDEYFRLHVKGVDYVVCFYETWMFHIYEGKTHDDIKHKVDLGGCSIKSDLINPIERFVGKKVCAYYVLNLKEY